MCGLNPVDAMEDRRVAEIYLAAFALSQKEDHAWVDLSCEMGKPGLENHRKRSRVVGRYLDSARRSSGESLRGRKILIDLCEGNIARLSAKIEILDEKIREKAEQTLARLGFDHSL